ncbi:MULTISPECIES: FadR/GntR family transcriptional regulator [unclassified Mesorhizobium]|uniref:FadR/GntR family transcriptional regulator n=1 Tax=unclassified Mesorhizobium TaxID=325217 RepID=UPI00167AFD12|nr:MULTISPECIES: FadR/GntR family transcriptional regulator [unclassified Mesorhizobium]
MSHKIGVNLGSRPISNFKEVRAPVVQLKKVQRVSLVERVTEELLQLIQSGTVKPGETLPTEPELMKMLGVGRSSIREAVSALATVGILDPRPRLGTVVLSPVENHFKAAFADSIAAWVTGDLFEVRAILEGHAAARAAERATDEQLAVIEKACDAAERKIESGQQYFEENKRFHLAIAEASRNPVLVATLRQIIGGMREVRERTISLDPAVRDHDVEDHRAIFLAIRNRDAKAARRLMEKHLKFPAKP